MLTSLMTIFTSPLEQFEVVPFMSLNVPILGSANLTLTNLGLYSFLILLLTVGVHVLSSNDRRLVPSR